MEDVRAEERRANPAAAEEDERAALQAKVTKLRWLLKCANAEIQKLKDGA